MLPHLYVGLKRKCRLERFRTLFPDAIDVIVRGIKSGVPLGDCLKIVAAERRYPRAEFKTLVADQALGLPLGEAVQRLPVRIPSPRPIFSPSSLPFRAAPAATCPKRWPICPAVLRERKKMLGKIAAMSAEAKASVASSARCRSLSAASSTSPAPHYVGLLFTTFTGNLVLAVCAVWMMIGIFVMRQCQLRLLGDPLFSPPSPQTPT